MTTITYESSVFYNNDINERVTDAYYVIHIKVVSYQPRDAPVEETYHEQKRKQKQTQTQKQKQKQNQKAMDELEPPTPEYFDVSYKYVFYPGSLTNPQLIDHYKLIMHPFYKRGGLTEGSMDFFTNAGNTTILKNTLTEKMMEYLLMPDEKLQVHSGPSSPQSYRQSVMLAITYFWN